MGYVLLLLILIFTSCNDNPETIQVKGTAGPQGVRGPKGDTGPQGPKGDDGDAGTDAISTEPKEIVFTSANCSRLLISSTTSNYWIQKKSPSSSSNNQFRLYDNSYCTSAVTDNFDSPRSFFLPNTKLFLSVFGKGFDRKAVLYKINVP